MNIRQAGYGDLQVLTDIICKANQVVAERFGLSPDNTPKHPSNCTEEWIREALEKGIVYYLLEHEGRPCGCVAMEQANEEVCYLERLSVLPEFQHRGFGEALVTHVFADAKKLKAQRVEIGTITEYNELSAWYQKLGFTIAGTGTFDHLPFNVTFIAKEL